MTLSRSVPGTATPSGCPHPPALGGVTAGRVTAGRVSQRGWGPREGPAGASPALPWSPQSWPGQALHTNSLRCFASPLGRPTRSFALISDEKSYLRPRSGSDPPCRTEDRGFPASSCLACMGNRINTEAGGLAVPLRYPSPVWGHPRLQRCAAELIRARSRRPSSREASYRELHLSRALC